MVKRVGLALSVFLIVSGSPAALAQSMEELDVNDAVKFNEGIKDFRPEMKVYSDGKGHYLVVADSFANFDKKDRKYLDNRFFWGDGKSLKQLNERGFAGTSGGGKEEYEMGFEDSRYSEYGTSRVLFKDGKMKIRCGDKEVEYMEVKKEDADQVRKNATFSPLPAARRTEYLFKRKGTDQYIFVDAAKFNYSYQSFRMWVGEPKKMNERKIKHVERYRDGGTTYIHTQDGEELFSPFSLNDSKTPTWNKMYALEAVDRTGFDLKSLGIPGVPSESDQLSTPCDPFFEKAPQTTGTPWLKSEEGKAGASGATIAE